MAELNPVLRCAAYICQQSQHVQINTEGEISGTREVATCLLMPLRETRDCSAHRLELHASACRQTLQATRPYGWISPLPPPVPLASAMIMSSGMLVPRLLQPSMLLCQAYQTRTSNVWPHCRHLMKVSSPMTVYTLKVLIAVLARDDALIMIEFGFWDGWQSFCVPPACANICRKATAYSIPGMNRGLQASVTCHSHAMLVPSQCPKLPELVCACASAPGTHFMDGDPLTIQALLIAGILNFCLWPGAHCVGVWYNAGAQQICVL